MNFIFIVFVVCTLSLSLVVDKTHAGGLFECNDDNECPGSATCQNFLCACPVGHVLSYTGTECLPLATKLSGKCKINEQCAGIKGESECRDGTCQCSASSVYLKGKCIKRLVNEETCITNDDCFDGMDYNSRLCDNGKCQCNTGYYPRSGYHCRRKSLLNEPCTLPSDCIKGHCIDQVCKNLEETTMTMINPTNSKDEFEGEDESQNKEEKDEELVLGKPCNHGDICKNANAYCSSVFGTCTCNKGYFIKAKECHKELGMQCTDKSECPSDAECVDGICNCGILHHYFDTNIKCRKDGFCGFYVDPVLKDGDLICNTDGSCKLLWNNFLCAEKNPMEKRCQCERGYKINEDFICEISCISDIDCTSPVNSVCSELSKCECPKNSQLIGDKCVPWITGKCSETSDCLELEPNAYCHDGQCACTEGYVAHDYKCYKRVTVGDECDINQQCTLKWNSTCSETKRQCECIPGFINVNGNCLKMATKVGDYCTSPFACMNDTICEKSKCSCPKGKKVTLDGTGCQVPEPNTGNIPNYGSFNILLVVIIVTFIKLL